MAEREIVAGQGSCLAGPSDGDVEKKEIGKGALAQTEAGRTRFWNLFDLRFEDQDLEAWFSRERMASWLDTDSFAHAMALVPSLMTLSVTWKSLSPWLKLTLLGTTSSCPLLWWWSSKPSYFKHRSTVLSFFRVFCAAQSASIAISGLNKSISGGSLLGRLAIWGPLAPLMVASTNVRLPFRVHLPVQIAAVLLSAFWIQTLCVKAVNFGWLFQSIEDGMDGLMVRMYLPFVHETRRAIEIPCYTVVPFLHVLMGFVLPTLVVFALEVHARAGFLTKVLGPEHHSNIHQFLHDALWFGCWAALFFTQASWALLSLQ